MYVRVLEDVEWLMAAVRHHHRVILMVRVSLNAKLPS